MGISSAWPEVPANSGTQLLPFGWHLHLPYSKTRAYFFLISMGILLALISSALDHARRPRDDPWLWLPVAVGVFGAAVSARIGMIGERPSRADLVTFFLAMVLSILVGVIIILLAPQEG